MAAFLTPLKAQYMGSLWMILEDFIYESDVAKAMIIVPEGFDTDFASVPRIPLAFLLAGDTAHEAAVIHDYLYRTKLFSRSMADAVFKEAAQLTGEPTWRVWLMWAWIRLGGWKPWLDSY